MGGKYQHLRLSQLDRSLRTVKDLPPRPSDGWLASLREAMGLSLAGLGHRLHMTKQSLQELEKAESRDRITLASLRRVADAMSCDLIYVLVPKSGSFSELAEGSVRASAARDVQRVIHTMALEDQKPENSKQLIEEEAQRRMKP